jgi:hypothetical protein
MVAILLSDAASRGQRRGDRVVYWGSGGGPERYDKMGGCRRMMLRQPWRSLVRCGRRPPENSLKQLEGLEIFCSYPEMMRIKMKVKLSFKILRWRKEIEYHWKLEQIKFGGQ